MKPAGLSRSLFFEGMRASLPVVLGYIPVGIAFGVLARDAGMSFWEASAMSLFVYAGASQFIAVEMVAAGAAAFPIIVTTFLVNLRHLLMSSAVACHMGMQPLKTIAAVGAELTDESFSVLMCRPEGLAGNPAFIIGLQTTAQAAWIAGTMLGSAFGALIDSSSYGIPFALPALFTCLLIMQLNSRMHLVVMVLAGIGALAIKAVLPGNWYIILSALTAVSASLLLPRKARS